MAEQVPAVGSVLTAVERRDWPRLEGLLDPQVHWTTAVEEHLHGPAQVIARLAEDKAVDIVEAREDLGFDPRPFRAGITAEAALLS